MSEASIQTIAKLLGIGGPLDDDILLSVQPVIYGRFGVFANAVLISINETQGDAAVIVGVARIGSYSFP